MLCLFYWWLYSFNFSNRRFGMIERAVCRQTRWKASANLAPRSWLATASLVLIIESQHVSTDLPTHPNSPRKSMKLFGSLMVLYVSNDLYWFVSSPKGNKRPKNWSGQECVWVLGRRILLWVARFTVRAEVLARRTETFETIFADFGSDRQFSWRQSKRGWSKELESLVKYVKSKLFPPDVAALSDQGFSSSDFSQAQEPLDAMHRLGYQWW